MEMNYLSVCSGIEAATVAWHHMGWKPVGFSEIEKFPSQVLAHHYPQVTNFGDMTKYKEWQIDRTIGLLVGGTPCQSFSVAGLRKGLEDPRGNLALTYCGILDHFRPKWFIWENVPGVLSSGNGRDFGSFLGAVAQLGYGFSYRVLDAQYFGVAQRRRRVFVVGHFGDWRPTAKVLFESDCLRRNTEKGRKKGQEIAGTITARFGNSRNNHEELAPALTCGYAKASGQDLQPGLIIPNYVSQVSSTITASGAGFSRPGHTSTAHENYIAIQNNTDVHAVAHHYTFPADMNFPCSFEPNISNTLLRHGTMSVSQNMAVRRLTEIECERLQGFPDNYTNIRENCPSGARYKALGNSMAVPVMRWIGERINNYERL
jgi:DNA (cytosine-5)-methyltransferase 1